MKFKCKFYALKFDLKKCKEEMFNHLRNSNDHAGKLWLEASVKAIPIPTWGGASRATFQKLAGELGTSVPIGRLRAHSTVAAGRASASSSGVQISKPNMYAGFVYETTLQGLIYNEYNKAVRGPYPQPWSNNVRNTPYRFQALGMAAWQTFASKVRLPDPFKHIKKTRL